MKKSLLILLILLAQVVSACSSAANPAVTHAGIEIDKAVILVDTGAMSGMTMGQSFAGYMQIKNETNTDDQLMGITCDFANAMLHETSMIGDVATMKEISSIDLPAGGTVEFKPGGLHIMFMDPKHSLKVGEKVKITLQFKNAGNVTASAIVNGR